MTEIGKKRFHNFVVVPFIIIFAGLIRSVVIKVFTVPFNFAPGGTTGIASMVEHATSFDAGWTYLICNVPLLIIGFFFLNKGFALKTGCMVLIASSGMLIWGKYINYNVSWLHIDETKSVLAAVASGVLGGLALSLMLRIGGSTGGTDVIAILIHKKHQAISMAWFLYGIDAVVVFTSLFVYKDGLTPLLMSLTEMFALSITNDVITTGRRSALKFEIITSEPDAISQDIIQKLGRSVTKVTATGMYSQDAKFLLVCVISKRQLTEFNRILKQYPNTFAYVVNTREVIGKGFGRVE